MPPKCARATTKRHNQNIKPAAGMEGAEQERRAECASYMNAAQVVRFI